MEWFAYADEDLDGDLWFEIEEMGIAAEFNVVRIDPAPAIEAGQGRVVLTAVRLLVSEVLTLRFEGSDKVLTATPTHRFYSADRLQWLPAADFEIGERFRTRSGFETLQSVEFDATPHVVYNLEVDQDHSYYVSGLGILAHNGCPQPTGSYTHTFESGKTYHGKGPESRATRSGNKIAKDHDDPLASTEWTPAKNDREAFKQEDRRIQGDTDGVKSDENYNQINSPGKKYREQDDD